MTLQGLGGGQLSAADIVTVRPITCIPLAAGGEAAVARLDIKVDVHSEQHADMTALMLQYTYLQVLDFLTTVAFLLKGVHEGNPIVNAAMSITGSPVAGLAAVKVIALLLGIYCWRLGKRRALTRVNVGFAALITWNLVALIIVSAVQ
jgi:hypothetical protein